MTEEQKRAQATLIALGVRLETGTIVESLAGSKATLACAYTGRSREVEAAGVVMVTSREPRAALYHALHERVEIEQIGDCSAPGIIASATYAGHQYARAMDLDADLANFCRERALTPTKSASSCGDH
jgi:dimethylamine/trimethylamine dehydrogenase